MIITRATYNYCCSFYILFLLVAHCDARKSAGLIFRALPRTRISSNVVKHLDVIGIVGDHVLLDSSTNSQPSYGYGSVSSPFVLPPFESLPPMPLPETDPQFYLNPPSTPQLPSSPGTTVPSPIGYGGGGDGGGGGGGVGGGGGYDYPSQQPPPSSSSNIPPIFPIENPPSPETNSPFCLNPPSTPGTTIPSPIGFGGGGGGGGSGGGGGGYDYPSLPPPPPPPLSSIGTSPIGTTPSPTPPIGGYVPSPTEPILSPPFSYEPSPPFSYEPSPPSGIIIPSPPFTFPTPTPPIGGFEPSPPVFQPPVVYPQPRGPPSPSKGPKPALWCVAKPAVPDPIVQEAMNYACGSGADCDSLQPNGSCFEPNTLFAHASYALNSYWQRTKVAGGTCEFGGSAILVTVDPSFDGCHFMYN